MTLAKHRGQRGSAVVTMALMMLVGVVLLEGVFLGYQFYMRRQLQNIADFSALAGAQQLSGLDCTAALAAASSNGAANGGGMLTTLTRGCGNWDPSYADQHHYRAVSGTPAADPNAVQVVVTGTMPFSPDWLATKTISANAIAIRNGTPVAVFSIASNLMISQLGCVAACGAIANVNLSMLKFLQALGLNLPASITVGQLTTLLSTTSFTYQNIVNAVGAATGLGSLSSVLSVSASVANLPVQLLTTANGRGLFTFDTSSASTNSANSALSLNLNVLDVLSAAVGVANRASAIGTQIGAGGITAQVYVIAPPSIGVGGVGAMAYSAQVRVLANVTTAGITGAVPLLGLIANVNLPIEIDVADASARLTSLCTARDSSGAETATFAVSAPLLQACVGGITASSLLSNKTSCSTAQTSQTVLSLVAGLATVNAGVSLAAFPNTGSYTLAAGQSVVTASNNLQLGTTLTSVLNALATQITATLLPGATGSTSTSTASGINGNATLATALLAPVGVSLGTAASAVNTGLNAIATLINGVGTIGQSVLTTQQLNLATTLQATSSVVTSLVSSVGQVVGGLLGSLIGPCGLIGGSPQACLASKLAGTQAGTTTPNALLAVIGAIANLLQPALNSLGGFLASALNTLLGANLGQANLTLTSLNCLGTDVRLVQ